MHLICALLHCLSQQCEERETDDERISKDVEQIKTKKNKKLTFS